MNNKFKDCLCHISLRTSSKANKYTAVEAYSYINRLGRHAIKKDMEHSKSFNMPLWAKHLPSSFWDLATKNEAYHGRQAVNLNIALPRELSVKNNISLMEEYITVITSTPKGKLPCSYALHIDNDKKISNPHFHLMVYERPIPLNGIVPDSEIFFRKANRHYPERGGPKKVIYFSNVKAPKNLRFLWAKTANKYLHAINSKKRMNALSFRERGINKIPQEHLGAKSSYLLNHGVETDRSKRNSKIILQNSLYNDIKMINEAMDDIKQCIQNQTPYIIQEYAKKDIQNNTQKNRETNLQNKHSEAQTNTPRKQEIHFSEMQNITQNIQQDNPVKVQTSTQKNQYDDFFNIQTTSPTRMQTNFLKKQKGFMYYRIFKNFLQEQDIQTAYNLYWQHEEKYTTTHLLRIENIAYKLILDGFDTNEILNCIIDNNKCSKSTHISKHSQSSNSYKRIPDTDIHKIYSDIIEYAFYDILQSQNWLENLPSLLPKLEFLLNIEENDLDDLDNDLLEGSWGFSPD